MWIWLLKLNFIISTNADLLCAVNRSRIWNSFTVWNCSMLCSCFLLAPLLSDCRLFGLSVISVTLMKYTRISNFHQTSPSLRAQTFFLYLARLASTILLLLVTTRYMWQISCVLAASNVIASIEIDVKKQREFREQHVPICLITLTISDIEYMCETHSGKN